MDGDGDRLSSGDGEVGEIDGEVREPLEPCLVSDTAVAGDGEVDTGLEDGVLGCVSVDSDPCRCGTSSLGGRHDEGAGDGGECLPSGWAHENGTGPVGAELSRVGDV